MPVTTERDETHLLIRIAGECTVTSAAELKALLLDGLASGGELRLDLDRAEAIDITVMQLLWAAGAEAERTGARIATRMPERAGSAAREAGFERFPGLVLQVD